MRCRLSCLWVGLVLALAPAPVLQAKPLVRVAEPVKQIALSEDKVTQYLAAAPALDAILAESAGRCRCHARSAADGLAQRDGTRLSDSPITPAINRSRSISSGF